MAATFERKNDSAPPGAVFHWALSGAPSVVAVGTDSLGAAATPYVTSIFIPAGLITGIAWLIGSVGGTNTAIVYLWDKDGNLIANSDPAGVTVGSATTMQRLPFTAPVQLKAGLYFIGVHYNGNTARIRTAVIGDYPTAKPAVTFGTPIAITAPSSFTTAQSPFAHTY